MALILLGNSDISRWPPSLYPSSPSAGSKKEVRNYGKSGAELADVSRQIDQWKVDMKDDGCDAPDNKDAINADYIFVCCAGENDIGSGRSVDQILETFHAILDKLFPSPLPPYCNIFIGPKFEPWLTNDNTSRKQYAKLNSGFQRAIRKHHACDRISYIDCLTAFCTKESATVPGAVYGGKAMPDSTYFDVDGLHLNEAGYGIWKRLVEEKITENMNDS